MAELDRHVPDLDHLVYAVPDLDEGVRAVEELLGVSSSPGGRHLGLGTHNRLFGLAGGAYLEVVAPDPSQPAPSRPRWFGLDDLDTPRLASWCVRAGDLQEAIQAARRAGLDLGEPTSGSRKRPDGSTLSWTFTDPWLDRAGGVIPFCIDWAGSPHPSDTMPEECACLDVRVEHPRAAEVEPMLRALGLDTSVSNGHAPRLVARLQTPNGIVDLS
ncbi:MAG: VOC family protein [Gemmatimonadetes bacterium]|nr:VOC family protein [Gemmatimonadota bacterium]